MKNKTNLFSTSVIACSMLGLGFLASSASAQNVFTMTGNGSIFTNSTNGTAAFTAVSGNTLNIGSTLDATGPFAATATTVNSATSQNPAPIINVFGTSSLEFSGTSNAARTQSVTVNYQDQSRFLMNSSATYRERVVINYNSGATSTSSGDLRIQDTAIFATFNFNSGSVAVAGLVLQANRGLFNLSGGNLSATSLNWTTGGTGLANINFTSLTSSFRLTAANIDALNTQIADGLFQINGVDQTSLASYNRDFSGGILTLTVVPEPGTWAIAIPVALGGLAVLRRRQRRVA